MEEKIPGDSAFEDFIKDNSCPSVQGLLAIVSAIKEKMDFISENYQTSLSYYEILKSEDPLKEDLKKHIRKMMENSLNVVNQMDFALMAFEDDDEDGEDDDDTEKKDETPDDDEEKDPLKGF